MRYIARVLEPSSSSPNKPALSLVLLREYLSASISVAILTLACWFVTPFTGYGAISLIYLLGVLIAGITLNRGPVLLFAALSALAWNFLFIPPRFTLHIAKVEDALTFVTYFIIAI